MNIVTFNKTFQDPQPSFYW